MLTQDGRAQHAAPGAVLKYGADQSIARTIVTGFDPVAWAYADLSIPGQDQRHLQQRQAAAALAHDGAPDGAAAAIGRRITAADVAPTTLAVFTAADGTVLHEQHLRRTGEPDRAGYTVPASVVSLLASAQDRPPYVLAVVDRSGADLEFGAGGESPPQRATVVGPDDEIEHNAPGGWAGLAGSRYQNRAEDSWKHNAKRVAEEVKARAAQVGAQVLVVSGDVRAVQLLEERLQSDASILVRHISGSRKRDGSQAGRAAAVEQALRDAAGAQNRLVLELFRSHLDPGGFAVEGSRDTIDALAAGRVATLLVTEPIGEDHTVWFGAGATELFGDHDAAVRSGRPVLAGRLVDVAVRSALLSGARVRVVPADAPGAPAEGIGAVCRFGAESNARNAPSVEESTRDGDLRPSRRVAHMRSPGSVTTYTVSLDVDSIWEAPRRCPGCGSAELSAVGEGEETRFHCRWCGKVWLVELGWVSPVGDEDAGSPGPSTSAE